MTADSFQMGIIGRCRIAGAEIRRLERPLFGLTLLGGLRVLAINPSDQSKRLAALPALRKQQLHLGMPSPIRKVLTGCRANAFQTTG